MWGQILGAAASIGADLWSADRAYQGQKDANRTNLQIAREQMGFQREMSNTAYQRAVADMRAAGINPMLAAMKGGASTPPGASTRVESEHAASSQITSGAVAKAAGIKQMLATTAATAAQARKTDAEAKIIEAQVPNAALTAQRQIEKLHYEVENLVKDVQTKAQNLMHMEQLQPLLRKYQEVVNLANQLGIPEMKATADFWKALEKEGKAMDWFKKLLTGSSVLFRGKGVR